MMATNGTGMADIVRFVATDVEAAVVPHSGHWIMEQSPQATIDLATRFLAK
jgi:pimeloyl-ACP methyl ester carboxylesterase